MNRQDIKIAILQMEGTNCEHESYLAFEYLGVSPEYVHLKELEKRKKNIEQYQGIFIPGGFSAGDYIRAGAIFAARLKAHILDDLKEFISQGHPVVGVCNGFQVLIELGLLPALNGFSEKPEAALATNDSNRFECRQTLLKHEGKTCKLTKNIPDEKIMLIPSAHMEGKLIFNDNEYAKKINEKQVVFRYTDIDGSYAGYPWNPNGSYKNIAGICNNNGNVLGMMPHPERAFNQWQNKNWPGSDGKFIFEGIIEYIEENGSGAD